MPLIFSIEKSQFLFVFREESLDDKDDKIHFFHFLYKTDIYFNCTNVVNNNKKVKIIHELANVLD
jgi:hypothetical protein